MILHSHLANTANTVGQLGQQFQLHRLTVERDTLKLQTHQIQCNTTVKAPKQRFVYI